MKEEMNGIGKALLTIAEFDGELVLLAHWDDSQPPQELKRVKPTHFSCKNLAQDMATDLDEIFDQYKRGVDEGYV